jgi:CRP-like cAMP-binding protein
MTITAGDEIGWCVLTEHSVRRVTAKALTPVRALAFNGRELRAECDRDPRFGCTLMKRFVSMVSERLDADRLQALIRL